MDDFKNKLVCVAGLGVSGIAACRLLAAQGARVIAVDQAEGDALHAAAVGMRELGVEVRLGFTGALEDEPALVVASPGVSPDSQWLSELCGGVRVVSELELGFQNTVCRAVGITGTNGKTTVTELVEKMLADAGIRAEAAGNIGVPACEVAMKSRDLDCVVLEVSSFQLEKIEAFRPTAAVLLNITPDHLDRHGSLEAYGRAKARIFENQEKFDWAIAQSEALAYLQSLGVKPQSKVVTFSAVNRRADIYQDRGLIVSRVHDWAGPLLDMADCKLSGPHNIENVMAALAVGRFLRVPLEQMRQTIRDFTPSRHRCEPLGERDGVIFVNDSKSTNPDSVEKALQAMPAANDNPNIHLIAGGSDKGLEYYSLGPTLARRVKRAYLIGEAREKLRAAWCLFAPCDLFDSLDSAFDAASEAAESDDVVLLSPGCASFDQFHSYKQRGELFRQKAMKVIEPARETAVV